MARRLQPETARTIEPPRARGRSIMPWLGGYAALATAAVIMLVLREPLVREPSPTAPEPTVTPTTPEPVVQAPGAGLEPPPAAPPPKTGTLPETGPRVPAPTWRVAVVPRGPRVLPPLTRGSEGTADVRRGDQPGILIVRIEAQFSDLADDAPIVVEIRNAAGRVLADTRAPWSEFYGGATVVLSSGTTSLPAGKYELRVRPADVVDQPDEITYPFELGAKN